ncbi:hypothetical protein [Pseudomonas sp.]|uniref:hypothetical protein n=1 Tax=Pseudomonas sp. TaxID=306 RepID=UPI0028A213A8|nr:hypothetical protein [Pseudomonas sp.]
MTKVTVVAKKAKYGKQVGETYEINRIHLRALVALGYVEPVDGEHDEDDEKPRKKRTYKRRDMQAE